MVRRRSHLYGPRRGREMSPKEREAARAKLREIGMPIKCVGCDTDYRTNVPACPNCGRGWTRVGG